MAPLSYGDIISFGSLVVAVIVVVSSNRRSMRGDVAANQHVSDQLSAISDTVREIKDAMHELSGKLDTHAIDITVLTEQVKTLFKRVDALEKERDTHD